MSAEIQFLRDATTKININNINNINNNNNNNYYYYSRVQSSHSSRLLCLRARVCGY